MSELDRILAEARARSAGVTQQQRPVASQNPFDTGERSYIGGFLESMSSALPELIGRNPTPGAVHFRSANPVSGFVSQVIPAIGPYGGMFALSRTAMGAHALAKGMKGAKAAGTALGMQTSGRPIIASAVKEMLRYSPLELGRLGVGAVAYPENVGNLFADVAISTMFEGALGGAGGFLRVGGMAKRASDAPRVVGQTNMLAHPVTDLRALKLPEAQAAAPSPEALAKEAEMLTAEVLNDRPIAGFFSKTDVPLFTGLENGSPKDSQHVNALFKPNTAAAKDRPLDKRKMWEGPTDSAVTLNPGELQPLVSKLGFESPRELAENVLQGRVLTVGSDRAAGGLNKLFESPAIKKYDDDTWAAKTDFGSHVVFKRIARAEQPKPADSVAAAISGAPPVDPKQKAFDLKIADDLEREATVLERVTANKGADELITPPLEGAEPATAKALRELASNKRIEAFDIRKEYQTPPTVPKPKKKTAPKVSPTAAPDRFFQAGDRWAIIHTDNPGAFAPSMAKLRAASDEAFAAMRRVYQPMKHQPHLYNQQDDLFVTVFDPTNVAAIAKQSRKTWVAETVNKLKAKGMNMAGLQDNYALQQYVDKAWEVLSPGMFKERRNTHYARFTALLQNRIRGVHERATEAVFGQVNLKKAGRGGTLNRNFERTGVGGLSVRDAVQGLSDDGYDTLLKINDSKTPMKELQKVSDEGLIPETDLELIQRIMQVRSEFDDANIIRPLNALNQEHNFNYLEGYIQPRVPLGEWSVRVKQGKNLFYLATGRNPEEAQLIAKAIVDEGTSRGLKLNTDKASMRHAVEMDVDDMLDVMKKVGQSMAEDPVASDDVIAAAMKRVRFMGERRGRVLPVNPRAPASMVHERTGIPMNTIRYGREEFVQAMEADMRRKATFAAVATYMDRWGHELLGRLRPQNQSLYEDIMRRAQQALGVEGQTTRWMNERLKSVLGPQLGPKAATKIAAVANKTLFAFQLGIANPTYALLNALSPLQTVLPQVAFVLRAPMEESARLLQFMPIRNSAGKTVAIGGAMDPMRVMWHAVKMLRDADEEARFIHQRLHREGVVNPILYEEQAIKIPQTLKESFQRGGWAEFAYESVTSLARNSESFARIVSANAGYIVGKQHLGLHGDKLYHFTRRFVESTNYLYGQSDRARIITGPIGSMFGLFKNWQMHFMGMMAVYAGLAIKQNVWGPLMWQVGAAAGLGGLGATPLRHIADGLAGFHEDHNDSFLWMQENWGRPWADMAWFGPMGALGVTLQASSTIPGTDVRNDLQMIFNSIVFERAGQLGGIVGDGIEHYRQTGENPLADPNIRDRLLAAGAPRAVSRAASVVEGNYVKSMGTGYPMMQEPSFTARVMHGLGINNVEIERQQIAARNLWKSQEARKAAITAHGRQMASAIQAGDFDAVERIEISAMAQELDMSSVYKSAKNFERREEGDLLDRYKAGDAARYRALDY